MIAYKRQKEIENFVSKPYYQLKAKFLTNNNESYEGVADLRIESKEEMKEFINKNHLTKQGTGIVRSVTKKERRNFTPRLHSITSLQSKVNKLFKYSSDNVLKTVQSLYEKKLVSYPRTDCRYIGEKEYAYLLNNVEGYKRVAKVNFETTSAKPIKRNIDNEKVTNHNAIIPTQKNRNKKKLNKLSEMEKIGRASCRERE